MPELIAARYPAPYMGSMNNQQIVSGNLKSLFSAMIVLTSRTLQLDSKVFTLEVEVDGDKTTFVPDACFAPSLQKTVNKRVNRLNKVLSKQGSPNISKARLKAYPDTLNMDFNLTFEGEPSEELERIINSAFESLGTVERL